MEAISLLIVALLGVVAIVIVLLVVAGVCAVCGAASFGHIFVRGLWALLLVAAVMMYGGLIEPNVFRVKYVDIPSDKLPESFDGYRIVHISDLHLRSFRGRERALKRAVEKINAADADLICFSGDLVTMSDEEIATFKELLSSLKAKDGVVSVMGNHDYCVYNRDASFDRSAGTRKVREAEKEMGWKLLDDKNVTVTRGKDKISVIGVQNISASRQYHSYGNLAKAMLGAVGDFKILVSHDPTHWRKEVLCKQNIDLMLSGHTHAMQISILGWCPSRYLFREYRGLYREDSTFGEQCLYVNTGLGETIFPLRIGVVPEITVLTLRHR